MQRSYYEDVSDNIKAFISHVPPLYNRALRRDMHRTRLNVRKFDVVLLKLETRNDPWVDGLPAEWYCRLLLNLTRQVVAPLWEVAIGGTPIPPDWANVAHSLYRKGHLADPDNRRLIVCANTEAKLLWMLIFNQWRQRYTRPCRRRFSVPSQVDHPWKAFPCRRQLQRWIPWTSSFSQCP